MPNTVVSAFAHDHPPAQGSHVFSKYLTSDSDTLTGDKLTIALKHLHVIAPIEENGTVVKYFAPVALSFHQDSFWKWLLPKRDVWSTSCQSAQATKNLTA